MSDYVIVGIVLAIIGVIVTYLKVADPTPEEPDPEPIIIEEELE